MRPVLPLLMLPCVAAGVLGGCTDQAAPVERCGTCTPGVARCSSTGEVQRCAASASGCAAWTTPVACGHGERCIDGACAPCAPTCTPGAVRCSGDGRGVHSCGEGASGCVDWLPAQPCGGGLRCTGQGECVFDPLVPHSDRIDAIADYLQTDPDCGGLPGGGLGYCAPVAVSNSLVWLADNGFAALVAGSTDRECAQHGLIVELGSERYMNTDSQIGTAPSALLAGLHRFLVDRGYTYQSLRYQGYRSVGAAFVTGTTAPGLDWIKRGLLGNGSVWINVGWYWRDQHGDAYRRSGGHWLTVVGYGIDERGHEDPAVLVLHDPAPWAGDGFANEHVRAVRIDSGTLTGDASGLPRPAAGHHLLEGMHLAPGMELAILDGAVVLTM